MEHIPVILLLFVLSLSATQNLVGDNVCERIVRQRFTNSTTQRVAVRFNCTSKNVCRTRYAIKKTVRVFFRNVTEKYCCPGAIRDGNICVLSTTPTSTSQIQTSTTQLQTSTTQLQTSTLTRSQTTSDGVPIEGAVQQGDGRRDRFPLLPGIGIGLGVIGFALLIAATIFVKKKIDKKFKTTARSGVPFEELYNGQPVDIYRSQTNGQIQSEAVSSDVQGFSNDLYDLANSKPTAPVKTNRKSVDMYDQLHLYGNEEREEHDYEKPGNDVNSFNN